MKCPYCGTLDKDHVLDSRPVREGAAIKRRRECEACKGRFTTFEEIEELRVMVVKREGRSREAFDRMKLRRAVELACKKRPVNADQIT
ncbi:MAG: transcriptional regulator NrdR, partial [Capsulimonadales bacterium]|nr:transcriptional regulator NrdR [Capsulimonadales bacterium]